MKQTEFDKVGFSCLCDERSFEINFLIPNVTTSWRLHSSLLTVVYS